MKINDDLINDIMSGKLEVPGRAIHVYLLLLWQAGGVDINFNLKLDTIKRITNLSVNTVQKAIRELIDCGLVEKQKPTDRDCQYRVIR